MFGPGAFAISWSATSWHHAAVTTSVNDLIRERWPTGPSPEDERFAAYVEARRAKQPGKELRLDDLYLAWWAAHDDSGIRAFETQFAPDIERLVARFHRLPAAELRQRLRVKLFVEPARIVEYSGVGFLQNWLRVTAARLFVDAARSDTSLKYEDELDEKELVGMAASNDPRLDHIRDQLGGAVKRAFAAAVTSLQPRERTFLRHAYVDRLTLDQIAATYGVHRATVARTLASAREHLIERTRADVARQLGVDVDDLASAIGVLATNLELSLSRVLRSAP
jgi:RNA polymerase sigma-70 factor (ECF subfamily)